MNIGDRSTGARVEKLWRSGEKLGSGAGSMWLQYRNTEERKINNITGKILR
jgi:hypothetical protein